MTAFQALVRENAEILRQMAHHPFVQGMARGTLPRESFLFYLRQDYAYLLEYTRAMSLALARMDTEAEMAWFARLVHETLNFEMDLHRRTCEKAGISRETLEATEPTLTTQAYTAYLVRLATLSPVEELIAGLLPCEGATTSWPQRPGPTCPRTPSTATGSRPIGRRRLRPWATPSLRCSTVTCPRRRT